MLFTIKAVIFAMIALLSIILISIFITSDNKNYSIVRDSYSLGTIVQLKAYGSKAEKAIEEVIDKLNEIDNKMSVFKGYSEVSKINTSAGEESQVVSKDTYFLIKKAVEYCSISGGAFDITIRPLVELWGIGKDNSRIPESNELTKKIKLVNYKDIVLHEDTKSVFLRNKEQQIDLGGIAKGFAADEAKNILVKHNIKNAIIDLGGNIFALGKNVNGLPWRIGIQDPLKSRGQFVGIINIINKSVVTSGGYERYFIQDDKIFHHIINPSTGYPSESDILSATIISDYSIDGDGLSTGIYIMGLPKAIDLIESIKGVDAIFINNNKEIHVTSGMRNNFILTNNEYVYN
ncbi:FAD:protein FMN transferase [Clostridium thailandense]|uniref:FAD:protein FMN transferase n=1 Tax=Clostridium thailandense TaxID=2794346 RepID=UPI003989EE31